MPYTFVYIKKLIPVLILSHIYECKHCFYFCVLYLELHEG